MSRRTRHFYRALDALYMAPARPAVGGWELVRETCLCTSHYDRVGALERILAIHAPALMLRLRRSLQSTASLPVLADRAIPFAFGRGSSCTILEGEPPRVLKVFRDSMGQDLPSLVAFARAMRDDYQTLVRWYADVPALLPRTAHVVLHAPLRGAPAAARIQDFVTGSVRDLLRDLSRSELVGLTQRSPCLADSVRAFTRATRRAWEEEGRCLELVGPRNVLLVDHIQAPELRVVDFGILDMAHARRKAPKMYDGTANALDWLEQTVS